MIVLGFSGIHNGDWYRRRYGLRFVGHDAALALVVDGQVRFAAEEERFDRNKHSSSFPVGAWQAAVETTGIQARDLDHLAYTWQVTPGKFLRMNWRHGPRVALRHAPALAWTGWRVIRDLMSPRRIGRQFQQVLGVSLPPAQGLPHHMGHVACAYYPSPFDHAAALTLDGQGEDESGTLGEWRGTEYRAFQSIRSPDSIGILYGMVTDFLGMRAGWDEYKVMGMAAHGDPERYRPVFQRLVQLRPEGRYTTWRTAMVFQPGYCNRMLEELFGIPPRRADAPLEDQHFAVAAALQETTERVVFHLLRHLRERSSAPDLCLAGGVFQNSVINGQVRRSGLFQRVFVPPVPGDHGGALGAALHRYHQVTGAPRTDLCFDAFTGPEYTTGRMARALAEAARHHVLEEPTDLTGRAAQLLDGGHVLGWFQGRMEHGPRALGHRSILADPRTVAMRDRVNACIKHREEYRPFAGSVPGEHAAEFFDLEGPSPWMQFVVPVHPGAEARIPAVVHFGTCRVQTVDAGEDPLFHRLLTAFGQRSGVPVLLNTSFNDADEPIVCTPEDAVESFLRMDLTALVMGPFVLRKQSASTDPA